MDPVDLAFLTGTWAVPSSSKQEPKQDTSKERTLIDDDFTHPFATSPFPGPCSPLFKSEDLIDSRRLSRKHTKNSTPKLACPFRQHDSKRFNSGDYGHCVAQPFQDIPHLYRHIRKRHTDLHCCQRCYQKFDSQLDLSTHYYTKINPCVRERRRERPGHIRETTFLELESMRKRQRGQTAEETWQAIYHLLFPNDGRTISPYFDSSDNQSDCDSESAGPCCYNDIAPSMTTASTIDSEVHLHVDSAYASHLDPTEYDDPSTVIDQKLFSYDDFMCDGSYDNDRYEQDVRFIGLGCSALANQAPEPQASPVDSFLPLGRITLLRPVSSLPTDEDFAAELSTWNSKESPSSASEESMGSFEEDETHLSDFDGIDSNSGTYLSFDPVRRALFNNSTRQFWNFYNGLSFSDLSISWLKYATYKGAAASSPRGSQKPTGTTSDQESPKIPSNAASTSLPLLKRKNRDDEDEPSKDQNPSKRSKPTSPQKKSLNLACPFHKYKPWMYNHGNLRFRTCSTTAFDAIYRLKQHLYRVHPLPIYCTRCLLSFANQKSLEDHSRTTVTCEIKKLIPVEGWTTEMDQNVTKCKDKTERGRWESIYRELFGKALTSVPSPYFVHYDLAAANETDLETLLHQEVPRIVLNSLAIQINNMDIPDAARRLFDPSSPHFQFEKLIDDAIGEVFAKHRSTIAAANNPTLPPTPQSLSVLSMAKYRDSTQPTTLESTPTDSSQGYHHQQGDVHPFPAVGPSTSPGITQLWTESIRPRAAGEPSNSEPMDGQVPPPAAELAPRDSEIASDSFPQNPLRQLQSAEEYIQLFGYQDMTSAGGANTNDNSFSNFDFERDFDDVVFPNVSSGPYGAPSFP